MQSLPFSVSLSANSPVTGFECGARAKSALPGDPVSAASGETGDFDALLAGHPSAANTATASTVSGETPPEADEASVNSGEPDRATAETLLACMLPFVAPPAPTSNLALSLSAEVSPDESTPGEDADANAQFCDTASAQIDNTADSMTRELPADGSDNALPPPDHDALAPAPFSAPPQRAAAQAQTRSAQSPAVAELATVAGSADPTAASLPALAFTSAPTSPAKISRASERFASGQFRETVAPQINFLNTAHEPVTTSLETVGTDVAKSAPETMSPRRSLTSSQPGRDPSVESLVATTAALFESVHPTLTAQAQAEVEAPATRALVQQVIATVEAAQASGEAVAKNVKLDFDFGDARVQVRIEIRDEVVRAHFKTDSAELRSSLNHEWQAAAAAEPARFSRVADPVFASDNSFANSENSRRDNERRESPAHRQSPETAPLFGRFPGRAVVSSSASVVNISPLPALASLTQLNAFA